MAMNPTKPTDYRFERPGFSAFSGTPTIRQRHRHDEVEMAVFGNHSILVLYGGRSMTVAPDRLVVLWGAMAHQALRVTRGTTGQGIRIPLTWVLQWNLPKAFLHRLLSFEVFYDQPRSLPCSDTALVRHWIDLMKEPIHSEALIPTRSKALVPTPRSDASERALESHRIVILEAEARLRRLALSTGKTKKTVMPQSQGKEMATDPVARHQAPPERFAQASGVARPEREAPRGQDRRTPCGATTKPIPPITQMAEALQRTISPSVTATLPSGFGHIEPMLEYIARHYPMSLHVTEIARAAGLSRNHAMRLFRQLTGMSLLEYITQHRMSHAQRLLVTTDMKVMDIAYEAGFSSTTRCYAAFERYAGESPASYRKAMRRAGCSARPRETLASAGQARDKRATLSRSERDAPN